MAVFWAFTAVSIIKNPWFDISRYTFSNLARRGLANDPWIFSAGVIIGGIFMVAFGISMITTSKKKNSSVGGSYVTLSGVFMILVGIFPIGTKPHDFIALSTFLLFYTGMMLYGIGSSDKKFRNWTVAVFIAAIAGLLCNCWKSLGYLEIYALSLVIMDLILILFEKRRGWMRFL